MKVGLGEIYALSPAACDANGEEKPDAEIALSTSNSKIAAVNGHRIKGVKTGTATITLSVAGVSRKIRVTVVKAPTEREAESDEPNGFRGRDGGIAGDASERGWHGRVENRRYGHRGNRKDGSCEREHDEGFAAHGKSRNGDDHSDFL